MNILKKKYSHKDFQSNAEVRWCSGCGDYAILASMQRALSEMNVLKENIVFISGIGCSSRFTYYMNTYGIHSIHGRAPTIATGLKLTRPDLSIWIITGDGDGLSIGGNHLMHLLRRNVNVNVILFNNKIYGLTKGQYSPTSDFGCIAKSTPFGSVEESVNPLAFALGMNASFVARSLDTDVKLLIKIFKQAHMHKGTSFIEIYQNCVVFNDGVFSNIVDRKNKHKNQLILEHNKLLLFDNGTKGIGVDNSTLKLKIVDLTKDRDSKDNVLLYDETSDNDIIAKMLVDLKYPMFPTPFGIFKRQLRSVYDDEVRKQNQYIINKNGRGDINNLLKGVDSWQI